MAVPKVWHCYKCGIWDMAFTRVGGGGTAQWLGHEPRHETPVSKETTISKPALLRDLPCCIDPNLPPAHHHHHGVLLPGINSTFNSERGVNLLPQRLLGER